MAAPSGFLERARGHLLPVLAGPSILAFLPAMTLAAWWLGGEAALIGTALGLPLVYALSGLHTRWPAFSGPPRDGLTGLVQRAGFETKLARVFADTGATGGRSACFLVDLPDLPSTTEAHGQAVADAIVTQTAERLTGALQKDGTLARIGDGRFAICLEPGAAMDLELAIQLAGTLHTAVEMPITVNGATHYPACAIGFCLRSQVMGDQPLDWMAAAQEALSEARRAGPSAIHAYSQELQQRTRMRADLRAEAAAALDNGQIRPWFQPQVSTDTGKVTGFEALARWVHPMHGMIPPDTFLPILQEAGLLERLGEVVLRLSLEAVCNWDKAEVSVPRVGVNFAGDELNNPRLTDRIRWELDRLDLSADRLSVEILETVVCDSPGDRIARNIAGLAAMGCRIDLDDFGTGNASLASVKRFSVSRLKIDRGFVMKADRDQQQQQMIAAILTMAERLGLETLAEGVETPGEHALLAQLGCDHVQGFGIGRPMPFDATLDWIRTHEASLHMPPQFGRDAG
ncbi:MAG: putative bifunctional diguanylate cyclase/phosphodiesterase [Paracoccaceae bacterium]